jgi:hypothetical protein
MEKKGKTGLRILAVRNWQDRGYLGFIAYTCVCLAWNFGGERGFEAGFAELGGSVFVSPLAFRYCKVIREARGFPLSAYFY